MYHLVLFPLVCCVVVGVVSQMMPYCRSILVTRGVANGSNTCTRGAGKEGLPVDGKTEICILDVLFFVGPWSTTKTTTTTLKND